MWKTILGVLVLIGAVLWLPVWLQGVLFLLALIFIPHRLFLLIPAMCADALYAPTLSFSSHYYTLLALFGIIAHWVIVHKTRIVRS